MTLSKISLRVLLSIIVFLAIFLVSSVASASHSKYDRYDDFRGQIVDIQEDASTTRLSNNRVILQHKRIDLLVETIDDDGYIVEDDDRYRVVMVVDEDGYYEKTVSALYKRSEDARRLTATLGNRTDSITIYLLCDNCRTGYKFGHPGAYNKWNIVDSVSLRVSLNDDFSSKRKGSSSYRKWKNFDDYRDFFDNEKRYDRYYTTHKYGSNKRYYDHEKDYDSTDDYDSHNNEYKSRDYDQYSWKDYSSLKNGRVYDEDYKHTTYGNNCYYSSCYGSKNYPTTTHHYPTQNCRSTTVGCGKPTKTYQPTPKYEKPVVTKTYYYNSNYQAPTQQTKVYQCSSNGCKRVYTQG